jgi:amino acid transporter
VGLTDWSMPQESVAAANSSHFERFLVTTRLSAFRRHPDSDHSNIEPPLRRCLEDYHIELIALGGAIGTGLLVGTGEALAAGGPISLLASFAWVGVTVYFTVQALGEMTILFPLPGSFTTFSGRFIDQAWGAAMGWNYAVQWLIFLPLELVASSVTLQYWGSPMPHAAWVTIFLVLITIINVFGVKGYGHVEASLGMMKVVTVVIFMYFTSCIKCGVPY